jgi:hypothetical protein
MAPTVGRSGDFVWTNSAQPLDAETQARIDHTLRMSAGTTSLSTNGQQTIVLNTDGFFKLAGGMLAFLVVWCIIGFAAFIMSLVCMTKAGSNGGQNVMGLLLAILFGPFYWLYYFGSGTYCKTVAPNMELVEALRGLKAS